MAFAMWPLLLVEFAPDIFTTHPHDVTLSRNRRIQNALEVLYEHSRCSLTPSTISRLTRSLWLSENSRPIRLFPKRIAHIRSLTRKCDACLCEPGSQLRRFRERSPPTTRTRDFNDISATLLLLLCPPIPSLCSIISVFEYKRPL